MLSHNMNQYKPSITVMISFLLLCFAALTAAVPTPQARGSPATGSTYWMSQIQRQGKAAYNPNTNYQIYRNVKDYGAVGDGNTDDTAAINRAISDGDRCGLGCDSTTITPAIVYFPPGSYKVSNPIVMYYYTQMIGDAITLPTIIAAPDFQGIALLDADPYIPGANGAGWYTNQNNFYRQIRNFVIDLRPMPENRDTPGIHWQVSQATSLQNIRFEMHTKSPTNKQRGLYIENGSGGFISDLTFNGGDIGMNIGSQQFTTRNIVFKGCNTAISLIWDWMWTFKSLNISDCGVGIDMASLDDNKVNQTVGGVVLMDSTFANTPVGITTFFSTTSLPRTGGTLVIHNVDFTGSSIAVANPKGDVILAGGAKIASWVQGDTYLPAAAAIVKRMPQISDQSTCVTVTTTVTVTAAPTWGPIYSTSHSSSTRSVVISSGDSSHTTSTTTMSTPHANSTMTGSSSTSTSATSCTDQAIPATLARIQQALTAPTIPAVLLAENGGVFERSKPQYEDLPVSSFVSVKSRGAKGDGKTDDTDIIQEIFNSVTSGQVVYFDHGAYVITKTVQVPKNIRITGEIWPLIMITGSYFSDENNPKPAFLVGNPGDQGTMEISDLIFETMGPAPGAIMMQWNIASTKQGACAMWDVHFRVGGTAGTQLTDGNCKAGASKVFVPECAGSFLMMHVTQQASAYLENTWFWLADHDLDTSTHNQTSIYNGRGILVESKGPTWLWGTASEHNVFYNYQFANAQNVFMGAIQTESAYYQAAPDALSGGFTPNTAYGDPTFSDCTGKGCKKTWGLRALNSRDIYMFGGGLYSFFEDYDQDCLITESCQDNMVDLQCSNDIYLYGMITRASTNMVSVNGKPVALQKDNISRFGSTLALFEQK